MFLCFRTPSSRTAVPRLLTIGVLGDLVHALADPDDRYEMIDGVDSVEGAMDGRGIADVADLQFNVAAQVGRPLAVGAVDLRT